MKRFLILFVVASLSQSCILFLFDHSDKFTNCYDPYVVSSSDTLSTNYGEVGILPSKGDTCWFEVSYHSVPTKFQPAEYLTPFGYIVDIEGVGSSKPIVVDHNELGKIIDGVPCETWYEAIRDGYRVYFVVPENLSGHDRSVKAKMSLADEYAKDKLEWKGWKTVLDLVQKGADSSGI
jgi:hypothetical protein